MWNVTVPAVQLPALPPLPPAPVDPAPPPAPGPECVPPSDVSAVVEPPQPVAQAHTSNESVAKRMPFIEHL
jgi:hypothetical protein